MASSRFSRRQFLASAGALTTLGFTGLQSLVSRKGYAGTIAESALPNALKLKPDPSKYLELPEGFSYRVVARTGYRMDDGFLVPGRPDGMAAFPAADGKMILICNHELLPTNTVLSPFGQDAELYGKLDRASMYDDGGGDNPVALGGTTNTLFDTKTGRVLEQRLSLAGTLRNCAGGPTPWGSWITCEEIAYRVGDRDCNKDHGYNFEVPARMDRLPVEPVALKGMGRFEHEAVAVDPNTGIVYETEDKNDGLIYRYIPNEKGQLHKGGRLQALAVRDQRCLDTRNWEEGAQAPEDRASEGAEVACGVGDRVEVGVPLAVEWVNLEEIEAPENDLRIRGYEVHGAARFARGEGMWQGNGAIYWACTTGGNAKAGQIWKYTPSPKEGTPDEAAQPGILELFIEPKDGSLIQNCDNLTVAPWGDLVVCEDGPSDNFLVGITPRGEVYKIARNALAPSELAGCCFSPDGSTLFVNIQEAGLTLAITGPWAMLYRREMANLILR